MTTHTPLFHGQALVVWMTCTGDRGDHAVTDAEFERVHQDNRGGYQALCGRHVLPGSLTSPPGRRCGACTDRLANGRRAGRNRTDRVGPLTAARRLIARAGS